MRIRAAITVELSSRDLASEATVVDLRRLIFREVRTWLARRVLVLPHGEHVTAQDEGRVFVEWSLNGAAIASLRVEVMRDL